jgi:hypothetical protein
METVERKPFAMITGSCLCGAVRFQIDGSFAHMNHCHCSVCRKSHGAAFVTLATCDAAQFTWTAGEDALVKRESSPGFTRPFCRHCGSSLPISEDDKVHVPAGCLDGDPGIRPEEHVFSESAAPWHVIADKLPHRESWDLEQTVMPRWATAAKEAADPVLRGSCLCGKVAFAVTEPFTRAHNCHCSRCRKARAAAHASNAFTSDKGVQFTQGEDQIELFKLPDAKFFTVAFCRTCGSGVPRKDAERGVAVIPMSALNGDPHCHVDSHIFIGSKASWYTPEDNLPKFDGPAT